MDSREFFRRARALAKTIDEPFVVIVSKDTDDGGKAGVLNYVARDIAARLIVKDRAALADKEQAEAYFAEDKRIREEHEADKWRNRLQVAVVRDSDVPKFAVPPREKDE